MTTPNTNTAISIIVPVYNAERTLLRCLKSLFNQTIANRIQYVFVNDASTDASLSILEEEISANPTLNTLIINNDTNRGSAYVHTIGIKAASAEFLMHCDSDDWIELDMADKLLNAALSLKADIVTSPFFINSSKQQRILNFPESHNVGNINTIPNDVLHFSLCNKLIRRNLITDNSLYPLDGVNCWEDLAICSRALALSNKTISINTPLYHYWKGDNKSQTGQKHKVILKDHISYAILLDRWFKEKGNDFYTQHLQFLNRLKFTAKIKMLRGNVVEITRWKATFPECNSSIFQNASQFNLAIRIGFKLLAILPAKLSITLLKTLGRNAE